MKELIEILKIVALCIVGAIVYGVVHDQITARVCLEYFTVAHPPVFGETQSPTLLGLGWGVIATWWVGLILGVPLGICARVGGLPRVGMGEILRVLVVALGVMLVLAMLVGGCGYLAYERGAIRLPEVWEREIPVERHGRFMFDACAHLASYGFGALLGNRNVGVRTGEAVEHAWADSLCACAGICSGLS